MQSSTEGTEILSDEECWTLLDETSVGRLAMALDGRPEIFPVNYVLDGNTILFRTAAGKKIAGATVVGHVALEIDGYLPQQREAWSVVVKGRARRVDRIGDIEAAFDLPLYPWVAHPKPYFVRIEPSEITGRRFHILDDVAPDTSVGWEPLRVEDGAVAPSPRTEYHPGEPDFRPD